MKTVVELTRSGVQSAKTATLIAFLAMLYLPMGTVAVGTPSTFQWLCCDNNLSDTCLGNLLYACFQFRERLEGLEIPSSV